MALTLAQEIERARLMTETLARTQARRPSVLLQRDLVRWQRRLSRLEGVRTEAQRRAVA